MLFVISLALTIPTGVMAKQPILPLDADTLDGYHSTYFTNQIEGEASARAAADAGLDTRLTSVEAYESRIAYLEGIISDLQDAVAALDPGGELVELADHVTVSDSTINGLVGPHVIFHDANVHVQNGSGWTGVLNGLGNLIVGYNESAFAEEANRYGSHNLIIGEDHEYIQRGGLVAGRGNKINGPSTTVSGGFNNTANIAYSSVSGGYGNTANGTYSSISGGRDNTTSNLYSSVSGGWNNIANNEAANVSGGYLNEASGEKSTVSGGFQNEASGPFTSVSGGAFNTASGGGYGSVSGGGSNTASGQYASVSGGVSNRATGSRSSISGGYGNVASGDFYATVSGGSSNVASGQWYATVSGGYANSAIHNYSTVSGGQSLTTTADYDHKP
jgi:hypothetical protein